MRFPNINPTAFEIFGLEIKWYGISYALGLNWKREKQEDEKLQTFTHDFVVFRGFHT